MQPMIAVTARQLPISHSGGWAMEPKLDGFRCIAHCGKARVALQSRQQRSLSRYFPEIIDTVGQFDIELVLDGELVVWRQGHIDFAALQQRLRPAQSQTRALSLALPATYAVFDILAIDGQDTRSKPYTVRRALLEKLLTRQLPHGLVLMPMTTNLAVARAWMINHIYAGVEGVVAKRVDDTYRRHGRTW